MHQYFRHLLALVFLLSVYPCVASPYDTLFTATYKGRHTGISVKMTKSLIQVDENRFILKSKAKSIIGSITEESHFLILNSKLVPITYQYYRKILGKKSDQRLSFDWIANTASYKRSDKPHRDKTFNIETGTLDPSLYQIKLQQQLFHKEKPLSYRYAKDSGVREMDFDVTEKSSYTFSGRKWDAVKLERINQKKKKNTIITTVPELNDQIVQITHIDEDGSSHTIKLVSYEANNDKLQAFYKRISNTALKPST